MARRSRPHPSAHEHAGSGPTQRQLRVGEVIRHALAGIFSRGELQDPALRDIPLTVAEVRVSPDMRHASVYVMKLGGGDMKPVLAGLERARGLLRKEVGRAITTRNTPELHFHEDTTFDTAEHVLKILRSEEVVHDLEPRADENKIETENGAPKKG